MTTDEALRIADVAARVREGGKLRPSMGRFNGDAAIALAAEVRRLRAAVEEIGDKSRTFQIAYGNYRWVKVDEVLAILEPKP